jgi:hypothetical protein
MALSSNGSPLWLHSPQVRCCRRSGSIPSGDRQKPFNGDKSIGNEALALVTTSACKWDDPTESSAPFPRWLYQVTYVREIGCSFSCRYIREPEPKSSTPQPCWLFGTVLCKSFVGTSLHMWFPMTVSFRGARDQFCVQALLAYSIVRFLRGPLLAPKMTIRQ